MSLLNDYSFPLSYDILGRGLLMECMLSENPQNATSFVMDKQVKVTLTINKPIILKVCAKFVHNPEWRGRLQYIAIKHVILDQVIK